MSLNFVRSNDVHHAIEAGVLRVTIDRPEKRNPLSLGVLHSLHELFETLARDEHIALAVITGAGDRAFASGGDLAELAQYRTRAEAEAFSRHGKAALDAIRRFPVPVVARINGFALGGGCELALACDHRMVAHGARLGMIHGSLGICPSWGGGHDLVRLLGPAAALEVLVRAETLTTAQAHAIGLVDAVCPEDSNFAEWFEERLEVWRSRPRQVLAAVKAMTRGDQAADRLDRDAVESRLFAAAWVHEDHWDAVAKLPRKA